MYDLFFETEITIATASLRILLSVFAGMLIGLERERHNQPAGLRTHILICVGATLIMVLSIFVPQTFLQFKNGDPGRIAAQVVSGIGFLGAGAIIRFGANVRGLTTAASIWVTAGIGLIIGAGMYATAAVSVTIVFLVLSLLDVLEKYLFPHRVVKRLVVYCEEEVLPLDEILAVCKNFHIEVKSLDWSVVKEKEAKIELKVMAPDTLPMSVFIKALFDIRGVRGNKLEEL